MPQRRVTPQLLVHLACAIHWCNPLVWVARAQARREREQAADDLVLACGTADTDYAEQVLHVAAIFRAPRLTGAAAIPMARASQLEGRLVAILDRTRNRKAMTWGGLALVALALLAVTIPVAILRATDGRNGAEPAAGETADAAPAPADSPVFAEAVAGRFGRAMAARKLPFLDERRLARLTADMRRFAAERLPADLPADRRLALLDATDAYVARNFTPGNPADPDSVDRIYVKFPDLVQTFQWHLWLAAERPVLDARELARRDAQHEWLREHVSSLPEQRPGVKREDVMKRLDALLSDPLDPLFSTPLPDAAFANVQTALRQYPPAGELAFAVAHAVQSGLAARYPDGERIPLPFEDRLAGWGAGTAIHLSFASNRRHAGGHIGVPDVDASHNVADVRKPMLLNFPAGLAGGAEVDRWLAREGRGDVGYDDANGGALFAVRGAKLLELDVHNWIDADRMPDAALAEALKARGGRTVPLAATHERYKAQGRLGDTFVGVLTAEGALSVVRVEGFGPGVDLHVRPRAAAAAVAAAEAFADAGAPPARPPAGAGKDAGAGAAAGMGATAGEDAGKPAGVRAKVRSLATLEMLEERRFHFRYERPEPMALAFAFYGVTPDGKVQAYSYGFVQDGGERSHSLDHEGSLAMAADGLVFKHRGWETGVEDSHESTNATYGQLSGTLGPLRVAKDAEVGPAYRVLFSVDLVKDAKPMVTFCYALRTAKDTETLDELKQDLPLPARDGAAATQPSPVEEGPPAAAPDEALTHADLTGTWEGEKDGVKATVRFRGGDDATWTIDVPKALITADLKLVDDPKANAVLLRLDYKRAATGEKRSVVLGQLKAPRPGQLTLSVLPAAAKHGSYTAVNTIPLGRSAD